MWSMHNGQGRQKVAQQQKAWISRQGRQKVTQQQKA